MWKIYYNDSIGGQNPDFWGKKLQDLDVGYAKEMGREDYMADIFLKYLPKKGKILDGGCGVGQHVLAYRDLGYQIEGLDFSDEAIEKIIKFDSKASCKKGNILKIEAADSSFDCYYSLGVIEHFEEGPSAAIKEARRILKDGGIFIVNVPYENLFRKIKFNILNFMRKLTKQNYIKTNIGFGKKVNTYLTSDKKNCNMEFHEYICNKREIFMELESNGFEVIYSSPCSMIWGMLEIPFIKKIYNSIYNNLHERNKKSGYTARTSEQKKRNLIKDIFIFEKRNGIFKNILVTLFGYLFGNLFLVVCRKD